MDKNKYLQWSYLFIPFLKEEKNNSLSLLDSYISFLTYIVKNNIFLVEDRYIWTYSWYKWFLFVGFLFNPKKLNTFNSDIDTAYWLDNKIISYLNSYFKKNIKNNDFMLNYNIIVADDINLLKMEQQKDLIKFIIWFNKKKELEEKIKSFVWKYLYQAYQDFLFTFKNVNLVWKPLYFQKDVKFLNNPLFYLKDNTEFKTLEII